MRQMTGDEIIATWLTDIRRWQGLPPPTTQTKTVKHNVKPAGDTNMPTRKTTKTTKPTTAAPASAEETLEEIIPITRRAWCELSKNEQQQALEETTVGCNVLERVEIRDLLNDNQEWSALQALTEYSRWQALQQARETEQETPEPEPVTAHTMPPNAGDVFDQLPEELPTPDMRPTRYAALAELARRNPGKYVVLRTFDDDKCRNAWKTAKTFINKLGRKNGVAAFRPEHGTFTVHIGRPAAAPNVVVAYAIYTGEQR